MGLLHVGKMRVGTEVLAHLFMWLSRKVNNPAQMFKGIQAFNHH